MPLWGGEGYNRCFLLLAFFSVDLLNMCLVFAGVVVKCTFAIDQMFVPPSKFIWWNSNPMWRHLEVGVGLWEVKLGHKHGTSWMGLSALVRKDLESWPALSVMQGYNKKLTVCNPVKKLSHQNPTTLTPDLGFPAFRTVRKKCLLFISYPVCGTLL